MPASWTSGRKAPRDPLETMISLLILDERSQVRDTLSLLFSWQPGRFDLSAACAHLEEARSLVEQGLAFDVVIVDPSVSSTRRDLESLAHLAHPRPLVAFSETSDDVLLHEFLRLGGRSFVLREDGPARLLEAIEVSHAGGAFFSPALARRLSTWITDPQTVPRRPAAEQLTQREIEVLARLAEGQTYSEVADTLGIGLGTVQSHVKSIYRKLEVTSKTEAATRAIADGLLPSPGAREDPKKT